MNYVGVNESFVNRRYGPMWTTSNWPLSWVDGVWGDDPSEFDVEGFFIDYIFEFDVPGKLPTPMDRMSNGLDESESSTVTLHDQIFRAGPFVPGTGIILWTITQIHFLDHGAHR